MKKALIVVISFVLAIPLHAQLSPGELSNPHAHLEGIKNCTACHELGNKQTSTRCLDCHKEIKKLQDSNQGYHSSIEVKDKKCASCHSEHLGRDFAIVKIDTSTFDHELTGYILEGHHKEVSCAKCHSPKLIKDQLSQGKGDTYLGLGTTCISCHTDVHQNTLSNDCKSCHNQDSFAPATGFDHNNSDFPLLGKHNKLECKECHKVTTQNGKEFQEFANIEHNNCTACHTDVHDNKFGNNCTKCHDNNSFLTIKSESTFDHDATGYPLEGQHQFVDCAKCHTSKYTDPLAHDRCIDCHDDFHEGDFTTDGQITDCNECHTLESFSNTTFTIEQHNKGNFILDGSHLATPCFSCHKAKEQWKFSQMGTACLDCHEDVHKGTVEQQYMPKDDCASCHTSEQWANITFDHNQTDFALEGSHKEVNCKKCHFNNKTEPLFTELTGNCNDCHDDIHQGQFKKQNKNDCSRCHTPVSWEPFKFSHDSARFVIDGAHSDVTCIECHKKTTNSNPNYTIYKFEDISCASCH